MKELRPRLVELFMQGYCTPQIGKIAAVLHQPSATIHYNVKKLESTGVIRAYKAVFNFKKLDRGHCVYVLANLSADKYGDPEDVAKALAHHPLVESVDIITGDYELLLKVRCKDIDEYYAFVKAVIKKHGFAKVVSMTSLLQTKSEFVE